MVLLSVFAVGSMAFQSVVDLRNANFAVRTPVIRISTADWLGREIVIPVVFGSIHGLNYSHFDPECQPLK